MKVVEYWHGTIKIIDTTETYHHPFKKNEILDIFYNGLTNTFKDHLDSCAGCVFRERTVDEAEILLNNMLTNENNWT